MVINVYADTSNSRYYLVCFLFLKRNSISWSKLRMEAIMNCTQIIRNVRIFNCFIMLQNKDFVV